MCNPNGQIVAVKDDHIMSLNYHTQSYGRHRKMQACRQQLTERCLFTHFLLHPRSNDDAPPLQSFHSARVFRNSPAQHSSG